MMVPKLLGVVFVIGHEAVAGNVGACAKREVVLLKHLAVVHGLREIPCVVVLLQGCEGAVELVAADLAGGELIVCVVHRCQIGSHGEALGCRGHGVLALLHVFEEVILHVFALSVHLLFGGHVEVVGVVEVAALVDGDVGCEVDVDLALCLGALCGHDDDAVGGAGTVDCGSGGVLEHVDAGDVIGVEVFDVALDGETVDHEQRLCLTLECADTADDGLASVGGETGHAALEVVHEVGGDTVFKFLGRDGGDGAGHLLLAELLITCHHYFGKVGSGGREVDREGTVVGHPYLLGIHADVGDHEHGAFSLDGDLEVAVDVGGCAVGGAFLHDGCSDAGFSVAVVDTAADHSLGSRILFCFAQDHGIVYNLIVKTEAAFDDFIEKLVLVVGRETATDSLGSGVTCHHVLLIDEGLSGLFFKKLYGGWQIRVCDGQVVRFRQHRRRGKYEGHYQE